MLTRLARRLRLRLQLRGDDGFSLVELIVSMGLATILGALTLTLFLTVNNSAAATTDRSIGADNARVVMQAWTSYLRVSDGPSAGSSSHRFEWITPTSTLFYADLNNRSGTAAATPPTMIWLRLDQANHELVEEQFALPTNYPTAPMSFPAAPSVCRILAQNVTALTITGYTSGAATDLGQSLAPTDVAGQPCLALTGSVTQTDPVANTTLTTVTSVGFAFTITATDGTRPQQYAAVATVPHLGS